jgi:elongation factor 1 alpha-like protein
VLLPFLKYLGFTKDDITWLPISGLTGANLMTRFEDKKLTSWYQGPCLIEALDVLRLPKRTFVKPLRITVNDIYSKGSTSLIGDCILGKIESGVLNGQKDMLLMPHNEPITIRGIMKDEEDLSVALAGQIVEIGIKLDTTFEKSFLKRGNVICCPEYPVPMIRSFVSRIVVYDLPPTFSAASGQDTNG